MIKELYINHKCLDKTTSGYSSWFDVKKGLIQERILSPFLSNVLMEVMLRKEKDAAGEECGRNTKAVKKMAGTHVLERITNK